MIGALGICSNGAGCVGAWVAPIGEHACQDNARCFGGPVEPAPAVLTDPLRTFHNL